MQLPGICVVVPTYWTRPGGDQRPDDALYDHPTPLDGQSTLDALLESLEALDTSRFYLLVLVAVTGRDVAGAAEERVRKLVRRYPSLVSLVFGPSHLAWLQGRMAGEGVAGAAHYLDLRRYPLIRNLQLAIPLALGTDSIVAVDDDEIVTDPRFVEKATEPLGTQIDGRGVDGLSGHYLQEDGTIQLKIDDAKARSRNLFDRKAAVMNAATEKLDGEPGNIVETPFCFGGNMEFTSDLAAAVGFDPGITRGEDIDYLINARMEGKHFFLRKDLTILHCPPSGGSYKDLSLSKLEQDVIRFVYEREKLRTSREHPELVDLTAGELAPYPGDFLTEELDADAAGALGAAGFPGDAQGFVKEARAGAGKKIEEYLVFRKQWPRLMNALQEDTEVADGLLREVK